MSSFLAGCASCNNERNETVSTSSFFPCALPSPRMLPLFIERHLPMDKAKREGKLLNVARSVQ